MLQLTNNGKAKALDDCIRR